jgi:MFS family permease
MHLHLWKRLTRLSLEFRLLMGVTFLCAAGLSMGAPLQSMFALELGASPGELGRILAAYSVGYGCAQVFAGWGADRFGPARVVRWAVVFCAVASGLTALATTVSELTIYRVLSGMGLGAASIGARVFIASSTSVFARAEVNAALSSTSAAGGLLGTLTGGAIAEFVGLRAGFVAVFGMLVIARALSGPLVTARAVADPPPAPARKLQWVALIGLIGSQLSMYMANAGLSVLLTPLCIQKLGLGPLEVSGAYLSVALGAMLAAPWVAKLGDRHGRRGACAAAAGVTLCVGLVMAFGTSPALLFTALFAAGAASAGFLACWYAMLSEAVGSANLGRNMGLTVSLTSLGTAVGASLTAAIWQSLGMKAAALTTTGAALVAVLIVLAPKPMPTPRFEQAPVTPKPQ